MTQQVNRLNGGLIDQSKPLSFTFNNKNLTGYAGDTVASALLANGQTLVGRSFKYHRPRGIYSAGSEEPNALLELGRGAQLEPNTRATVTELYDGLSASSQNHRGPLAFDFMAINDYLSPFLSAGFYYKTFMWPKAFWEKLYEPVIRKSAGLGSLSGLPDPDNYDKGFLHTDLLIIGAGAAGLWSALVAARSGARVLIADEDFLAGGRLNSETHTINEAAASTWAATTLAELQSFSNVRFMMRTTVFGAFDHGIYGALERVTDHLPSSAGRPRQIFWRIYAKRTLLATGATERSIAFGNNDRPGIMLAGAVRSYVNRYAATPGKQVAVFTNNDDGWKTAHDLTQQGVSVAAVIDTRPNSAPMNINGADIFTGEQVTTTTGRLGLKSISISNGQTIKVDCLAVSGGWNPNVHLTCHQRGRPVWNKDIAAFVPGADLPQGMQVIGAANGALGLADAFKSADETTQRVLQDLRIKTASLSVPHCSDDVVNGSAFWHVSQSKARAWIDLQNDVTSKDIDQSRREGFHAVEHLKRYTTLGMATDQGKTANVLGLAIMAELAGKSIPETGTTIFRPPYSPIAIAAFSGRSTGKGFRPTRLTPSHQWAEEQGAVFVEVGSWLRAQWYPKAHETHWRESVDREVTQTRNSVGICDVTTLGKIDIQGADAGEFLNRVYANTFGTLAVGKVRYGLMLREDGIVMDDGTTARLDENHYLMTTTTANAVSVYRHLEFCKQCLWPNLDVHLISATEQWAQYAVAGPNARKLLHGIVDTEYDISNDAFPFMACANITVCGGTQARLFRISFSGELAYELAVPARYGDSMIRALMEAGKPFDAVPYGTEALSVMRIEKGHAAGNELNGQTSALNLGLGRMVSKKKDCIGNVLSERPGMNDDNAVRLVGFKPVDTTNSLVAGSHFVSGNNKATTHTDEGWMTSVAFSPSLGHSIGLGFLQRGHERIGETVSAVNLLQNERTEVEVVSAHFIDPDGERLRV